MSAKKAKSGKKTPGANKKAAVPPASPPPSPPASSPPSPPASSSASPPASPPAAPPPSPPLEPRPAVHEQAVDPPPGEIEITGRTVFLAVVGLTALVLLISLILAADNRKEWTASVRDYSEAQAYINEGDYTTGLEKLQGLSPSYLVSPHAQLLLGTCYAGLAEAAKDEGRTEEAQADMERAAQYLERARENNFQLAQSQGYVNGYAKIMLELGHYEVAQQYFLQSVQLNTHEELTQYAQENLENLKNLAVGGVTHE